MSLVTIVSMPPPPLIVPSREACALKAERIVAGTAAQVAHVGKAIDPTFECSVIRTVIDRAENPEQRRRVAAVDQVACVAATLDRAVQHARSGKG